MTMYELASGLLYYFLVIPSGRPVPLQSIASDRSHRKPSLPPLFENRHFLPSLLEERKIDGHQFPISPKRPTTEDLSPKGCRNRRNGRAPGAPLSRSPPCRPCRDRQCHLRDISGKPTDVRILDLSWAFGPTAIPQKNAPVGAEARLSSFEGEPARRRAGPPLFRRRGAALNARGRLVVAALPPCPSAGAAGPGRATAVSALCQSAP